MAAPSSTRSACIRIFAAACVFLTASTALASSLSGEEDRGGTGNQYVQEFFSRMEMLGESYNSGGSDAAGQVLLQSGCVGLRDVVAGSAAFQKAPAGAGMMPGILGELYREQYEGLKSKALDAPCAALQGGAADILGADGNSLDQAILVSALSRATGSLKAEAEKRKIPFLPSLEFSLGTGKDGVGQSVSAVQPLWQDETDHHHVFTQVSWYRAPKDLNDSGFRKQVDTINAGLAYRYLTDDRKYLYGANIFFDHAPKENHNRMSLGVDARTSQAAVAINRYMPLSGYKVEDLYYESKAAAGWDLDLRGQVPEFPSWTGFMTGYEWDNQDKGNDLYGVRAGLEYSPVPALSFQVAARDESQEDPSLEAMLSFRWRFDEPEALQLRPRTELAPVGDYVYEKVRRDNIIRVQTQRRESSKLTVVATTGSNSAIQTSGTLSLSVGRQLLMPVTVTTGAAVGTLARLRFSDSSLLTLGQSTTVTIKPDLITLVSGTMQYVSHGIIHTIIVPGGTITLHGTDIDVVSDGTDSSVRVRDGSVDFTGTVSGSASLSPQQAAESVAGVIGGLAEGSAGYVAHADTVSTQIDRVAPVIEDNRSAPYPYEAPRVISSNMTVGGNIVFGLKFSEAVTISGGTPRLAFTINGTPRLATLVSGNGTDDLRFSYTNLLVDTSATSLTVTGFDKNGATIMGNGKYAVVTIADKTLAVSGTGDITAPSGYTASFTTDPVNNANKTAAAFDILSGEAGATYSYTITDGVTTLGPVTGTMTGATESITGVDVSSLTDGTLTVSVTLTDTSGNTGIAATDTVTKDTGALAGYSAGFTTDPVNNGNKTAAAFDLLSGEAGATYSYTITDGVTTLGPVTGTMTGATESITGVDVSSLVDGTLTLTLVLTDASGNVGSASVATVTKDVVAPTILSVTAPASATYEP